MTTMESLYQEFLRQVEWMLRSLHQAVVVFLGIYVHVDQEHNVHHSQTKYINEIVKKLGQKNNRIEATPIYSMLSREQQHGFWRKGKLSHQVLQQ